METTWSFRFPQFRWEMLNAWIEAAETFGHGKLWVVKSPGNGWYMHIIFLSRKPHLMHIAYIMCYWDVFTILRRLACLSKFSQDPSAAQLVCCQIQAFNHQISFLRPNRGHEKKWKHLYILILFCQSTCSEEKVSCFTLVILKPHKAVRFFFFSGSWLLTLVLLNTNRQFSSVEVFRYLVFLGFVMHS